MCPETHFQCHDNGYCLPIFVRCNGVYDCPGKEDEGQCNVYTCPGYYGCRGSRICLHPVYMCDNQPQCPQKDDELLCGWSCPQQCVCRGFAFTCAKPFTASAYLGIRYLNASDSGMTPANLTNNRMLIHLDLSRCGLGDIRTPFLPNLNSLDLSDNLITNITTDQLFQSSHLKVIVLSGNPLSSLFTPQSQRSPIAASLKVLDLSRVTLAELNIETFLLFPQIEKLNLSSTGLQRVVGSESGVLGLLHTVDLRGCPVSSFSKRLFRGLSKLRLVYTDNYKICCSQALPDNFNIKHCHGPSDIVSSCDSLLRLTLYKTSFIILTVFVLVCNAGHVVISSISSKNKFKSNFHVFHTHITACDFLMGIHSAVVTAADQTLRGSYLWEDTAWRHSVACQVLGFLYVLSTDVSALLMCLVTLDRCMALRYPLRHARVGVMATHVACGVVWAGCVLLAAVPLVPGTSLWHLYSKTGACQPLASLLDDVTNQGYTLTIIVGLTLALLLVTCVAMFYLLAIVSQQSDILTALKTNRDESYELTVARRSSMMLLFDMMCWSWLCLVVVLRSASVSVSIHLQLATAMCVLPLKATLNPVIYLVGCLRERQRHVQRQRLFKRLGVTSRL